MYYHWQNLNEDRVGHPIGSGFFHGRAWLHLGQKKFNSCFGIEWSFLHHSRMCGIEFSVLGSEKDFGFSIRIPFIASLHIDFSLPCTWLRQRFKTAVYGYDTGFTIFGGTLYIQWFRDDVGRGWHNRETWWQRQEISFNPADFFLGYPKHSERTIKSVDVEVPMVEKMYPGTVRFHETIWKRPRWPFPRRRFGATLELEEGIPVPGKGENSYDCGEDCIYGSGSSALTEAEAVSNMVRTVLKTRERYGGRSWKPSGQTYPNRVRDFGPHGQSTLQSTLGGKKK